MALLDDLLSATKCQSLGQAAALIAAPFASYDSRMISLDALIAMCQGASVEVKLVENAGFEGRYRKVGNDEEIVLRKAADWRRARFTLAHEIGHMLNARHLPSVVGVRYRSEQRGVIVEEERIANAIAAEILMPARAFRKVISDHGVGFAGIAAAQRIFGASFMATLRRCSEVTMGKVILINLVPRSLFDTSEKCIVDEATFILPNEGAKTFRDEVAIRSAPRFVELKQCKNVTLELRSPFGEISSNFETRFSSTPCENADLLSVI